MRDLGLHASPTLPSPITAPAEPASPLDELAAAAVGRVTRQLTHELRNALTGMQCFLELLEDVPLPEAVTAHKGEVAASIERMTDIASGWCDVASGRTATAYVNASLHRLVELYRKTGYEKKIAIEAVYDERASLTTVDPVALQSTLFTLMARLVDGGASALRIRTDAAGAVITVRLEGAVASGGPASGDEACAQALQAALGAQVMPLGEGTRGFCLVLPAEPPGDRLRP